MKPAFLAALLAVLLPLSACNTTPQRPPTAFPAASPSARPSRDAAASTFDFFLLNLSWSPEYCQTHPTAAECAAHDTLVLHGLWPENDNGTFPENCSNLPGPANPSLYKDIYPDMSLLKHEWKTHGTCSGLAPDAFFTDARTAFHSIMLPPTLAQLKSQTSLPPSQIINLFTQANPAIPASSLAISCGNNFLTAVEVCLDKNLHAISCGALKSCKANTVRIPAVSPL